MLRQLQLQAQCRCSVDSVSGVLSRCVLRGDLDSPGVYSVYVKLQSCSFPTVQASTVTVRLQRQTVITEFLVRVLHDEWPWQRSVLSDCCCFHIL